MIEPRSTFSQKLNFRYFHWGISLVQKNWNVFCRRPFDAPIEAIVCISIWSLKVIWRRYRWERTSSVRTEPALNQILIVILVNLMISSGQPFQNSETANRRYLNAPIKIYVFSYLQMINNNSNDCYHDHHSKNGLKSFSCLLWIYNVASSCIYLEVVNFHRISLA